MSVFKKWGIVSFVMIVDMVIFVSWNVLVFVVDYVIEEMEYVGFV